ncbi:MAG TPA: Crp/Fnr family transcriptional regulator [Pseudobdellovibrionaceae bacterium]
MSKLPPAPTEFCPICSSHEEKVTDQILQIVQKKSYAKNCVIFEQEQEASGIYLIQKGSVKISRISPLGKEILIEILSAGKTFGASGLFGQGRHADTATTSENCELFVLPKKEFKEILSAHPELYHSVIQSLCEWMDRLNNIIENINTPSARERVASYLKRTQQDQNNILIHLNGKKHEVAMMLGLRPETFSRALAELEAEGIIKMNHKQIQILLPVKL